jgi:hypothetical protein
MDYADGDSDLVNADVEDNDDDKDHLFEFLPDDFVVSLCC